jgi:hypothetical protein
MVVTWITDIDGNGRAGIRWMELRKESGSSSWTIWQQNNFYSPNDSMHRWMSSIAMNGCGDIALGYSVSSSTVSPGIRITGRLSDDPLNQLNDETTVIEGMGWSNSDHWGERRLYLRLYALHCGVVVSAFFFCFFLPFLSISFSRHYVYFFGYR